MGCEGTSFLEEGVSELVTRFGGSASVALVDPHCKLFRHPEVEGVIGYRSAPGCAVVFGDPVCAQEDLECMTRAFHEAQGKNSVVYVTASERFTEWALKHLCKAKMEMEEELVINPQNDPTRAQGSDAHQLRKKLNRASDAGVAVLEHCCENREREEELKGVAKEWLEERRGPQIYMAKIDLFGEKNGKRWFYAVWEKQIVGVLVLHLLEKGWLVHMVMCKRSAPQGTSETLVVEVLKKLKEEGCTFVTLGATPKEEIGEISGLSRLSSKLARKIFSFSKRLFELDNRREYWKKYKPQSERRFLLFSRDKIGMKEILGIMRAFNVSIKG